ncbi:MAG: hypothetical protein QOI57_2735 [Rubrobacteraceae bacterium]|nr:hypothetical protein [Rubrobacteraceae bacterium]
MHNPSQDNTLLGTSFKLSDPAIGTVEVIDPAHPLYAKTFPLFAVTRKQRVGKACIVWVRPGVKSIVPLAATDLVEEPPRPPSPCRLSVDSARRLLAVVASITDACSPQAKDAHHATRRDDGLPSADLCPAEAAPGVAPTRRRRRRRRCRGGSVNGVAVRLRNRSGWIR